MKTCATNLVEDCAISQIRSGPGQASLRPGHLHLVSAQELQGLGDALARGQVPLDLEAKLDRLAKGNLGHCFIEQNCRTIVALLVAAQNGSFKAASRAECERLLRLLAYVRKDEDAVPDYRPDGFSDDQQEVRAVTTQLSGLLQGFKAWRLRHQVPGMWFSARCLAAANRAKGPIPARCPAWP